MQPRSLLPHFALFVLLLFAMSSCDLIGGIFEAGAWTGGLLVVGILAVVIWLLSRLFGRGRNRTV